MANKQRLLITSALPYVNGIKHLGNLVGSMLPADVHARFRRMSGHETLFICGTDEHGTPAELAAFEEWKKYRAGAGTQLVAFGVADIKDYCDRQHRAQKAVGERFGLSFDHFGQSSCPENHRLTQELAWALEDNGFIEERVTRQLFCPDDPAADGKGSGRFLPDRYVEGTCPHCGYGDARGDQCDGCSAQLEPSELVNPRSKISGSTNLDVRETAHLFLRLSDTRILEALDAWVKSRTEWPDLARGIARKWLKEGLRDRSITRDLAWGVPVVGRDGKPRPGYKSKVFYVWFDAPIAYIAITQDWAKQRGGNWERWWRTDRANDVSYIQFMGQDNVPFHTVSFPATILGSGWPLRLVDGLKAFRWLQLPNDTKFSTSRRTGFFMDEALRLRPADEWRWYLIGNAPEASDATFRWELFRSAVNSELGGKLGNMVNRVLKHPALRHFDHRVPAWPAGALAAADEARRRCAGIIAHIAAAHNHMELRDSASATRDLWDFGNQRVQTMIADGTLRAGGDVGQAAIRELLELVRLSALVAAPIIPATAAKILAALGVDAARADWPDVESPDLLNALTDDAALSDPGILFQPVPEEEPRAREDLEAL